jgi:hypothetical protein
MMAVHLRTAPSATHRSGAAARQPSAPARAAAQTAAWGDDVVRRSTACACGGGCPRCATAPTLAATPGAIVQRAPADGGSWLPEPQDEPTSYLPEAPQVSVPEAPTDPTSSLPETPTGDDGTEPGDGSDKREPYEGPKNEKIAWALLYRLANAPPGPDSGFAGQQGCPKYFCQTFVSEKRARRGRAWAKPILLEGIRLAVDSRVVPLWKTYIDGGAPRQDLTATFGADFTAEKKTRITTKYLRDGLKSYVQQNRDALMPDGRAATVDFTPRLVDELKAIDEPGGFNEMSFNDPRTAPGNLAGAIGKEQTSCKLGAQPSPVDDARKASVMARLEAAPGGNVLVTPSIYFTVQDTLDLCPGHCGGKPEQVATVPLSRFEATGISGDVPFWVTFAPPADLLAPFEVAPSSESPPPP